MTRNPNQKMIKIGRETYVIPEDVGSELNRLYFLVKELESQNNALYKSIDEVHLALTSSENAAEVIQLMLEAEQEENIKLRVIIKNFFEGFEHNVFGVLPNGNEAFGCDEGEVRSGELLNSLHDRWFAVLEGGLSG